MPNARNPWPLKWIVLGIVLFILPYTYLTLHFRKTGPSYLLYEDTRARARAGHAGYNRIVASAERPADLAPPGEDAGVEAGGGLPAALTAALAGPVILPASIDRVSAPSEAAAARPYDFEFGCTMSDNREQPDEIQLYVKGGDIFVIPSFVRLEGGLNARRREIVQSVEVPRYSLAPGRYQVTLVGGDRSRRWNLQVR